MYVYLLHTLSIQISKTKLLVKKSSESWCFATLTEEDLQKIIDNNDLWRKIFMKYSKTNTTWFISRSSKTYWSLGVGCVRLLPSASRQEVVSCIQHLGTSNFYYFPQYHVVFVYCHTSFLHKLTYTFTVLKITQVGMGNGKQNSDTKSYHEHKNTKIVGWNNSVIPYTHSLTLTLTLTLTLILTLIPNSNP